MNEFPKERDEEPLPENELIGFHNEGFNLARKECIAVHNRIVAEKDKEIEKLREFVEWCLVSVFEGCGIDGGDAQDKLESLGLIELRPIPEEDSIDGEKEHYFTVWTPKALAKE